VANDDRDDDWIFHDARFRLANNDQALLAFLAEMLHPAVRTDPAEVERLRDFLNSVLVHDGYELVQTDGRILRSYAERFRRLGGGIAALIPQVYLHYDPYTAAQRGGPGPVSRQRMDFLLLLPHRARVVIECDGKQHYADDNGRADPRRCAAMMADDRDLRLKGYEVYRFGGAELVDDRAARHLLSAFFDRLDQRYHQ
jgi:hypothetical protein